MKLKAPIPIFRIFDYQVAQEFYADWLGFAIDWEFRFAPSAPRYIQVSRDSAILHLTEHEGDCAPGAQAVIHTDDVDALLCELFTRPFPGMNPTVEDAPWNAKILKVADPFGNRLCFNQPLDNDRNA